MPALLQLSGVSFETYVHVSHRIVATALLYFALRRYTFSVLPLAFLNFDIYRRFAAGR